MVETKTVTYYHNYDRKQMEALENDPNKVIISRKVDTYDTVHMLPLHLDPKANYMLYRTTYSYYDIEKTESPSQHPKTSTSSRFSRAKTLGDTNEFISAFWINGKPKCRTGYRYDFSSKMCRLIK